MHSNVAMLRRWSRHVEALATLEGKLIAAADNAKLEFHLAMTRDATAPHVDAARHLQANSRQ